ncbi:MAG TPA: heavy metal-binding domain-containing protein [Polyangiaceae bacterium]|nr:heavy metal-binding domain-containing protein [Polyangiaceae bacterium]
MSRRVITSDGNKGLGRELTIVDLQVDTYEDWGCGVARGHYICPMHPELRSERLGICPKCGVAARPLSSR